MRSLSRNLNARINFLTKNFVIQKLEGGEEEKKFMIKSLSWYNFSV